MEWTIVVGIAITMVTMVSACFFDWRRREVPDAHWWVIGSAGIVLTAISRWTGEIVPGYFMMSLGSLMILADILLDSERPAWASLTYYAIVVTMFAYPAVTMPGDPTTTRMLIIPVCFALFYLLYLTGVLKGGADVKCLIVIAMMFQFSPEFPTLPIISLPSGAIQSILSYPIVVLFHASLFSLFWLPKVVMENIKDGTIRSLRHPFWYRMSIEKARESFVWPVQDVVDGKAVFIRGTADEDALDRLEEAGATDVWVTPIIPFMLPITMALAFTMTVGSLLSLPFNL